MKEQIIDWMCSSTNKGTSSKAMAAAFLDREPEDRFGFGTHPADPADFNRCLLLLETAPEARKHMDKVAALSDKWKKIVENWDELENCFLDEVGLNWSKGRDLSATKTYKMMKNLGC